MTETADRPRSRVPGGHRLLLALGRLAHRQGVRHADPRAHACPGRDARDRGSGPELAKLLALAQREGVADGSLLGWRRDAGALLKAADLFVCSSRIEPLGNMVIEAWSAGMPDGRGRVRGAERADP